MIPSDRRYSQHARRSLVRARLLAQQFAHPAVDTDHLLLGIWWTEGSIGYRVLSELGVDRAFAQETVRYLHPQLGEAITPAPYSRNLQAVLLYATDEAYWLGQHYIGTEHILLGLVRASTGQLSSLLYHLQISSHQLRQRIRRLLSEGAYESSLEAVRRSARLSELSRRVLNAAAQLAAENDHQTTGLEHLLLVLGREKRSMAARLLLEAGLDEARLAADLRRLQPDPTLAATALDEVMGRAVEQTETLGTHYTGTDHILLAMTMDDEAVNLMRHYGVDIVGLQRQLKTILSK